MKLGISALFLLWEKMLKVGGEVGLSYAFISHTMQLVIMLVMGLISIPMLAKIKKWSGKIKRNITIIDRKELFFLVEF